MARVSPFGSSKMARAAAKRATAPGGLADVVEDVVDVVEATVEHLSDAFGGEPGARLSDDTIKAWGDSIDGLKRAEAKRGELVGRLCERVSALEAAAGIVPPAPVAAAPAKKKTARKR